jgi:ABC-type nitrate/sulfonate/bicarbonate transport system substrate-binding protein
MLIDSCTKIASEPLLRANLQEELRHAGEYAAKHAAEMARVMSSEISIEPRVLEVALGHLTYGAKPIDEDVVNEQQEIADTFHSLGLLSSEISVRRAIWQVRDWPNGSPLFSGIPVIRSAFHQPHDLDHCGKC